MKIRFTKTQWIAIVGILVTFASIYFSQTSISIGGDVNKSIITSGQILGTNIVNISDSMPSISKENSDKILALAKENKGKLIRVVSLMYNGESDRIATEIKEILTRSNYSGISRGWMALTGKDPRKNIGIEVYVDAAELEYFVGEISHKNSIEITKYICNDPKQPCLLIFD